MKKLFCLLFLISGIVKSQTKSAGLEQFTHTQWKLSSYTTVNDSVYFSRSQKVYTLHFIEDNVIDFFYGTEKVATGKWKRDKRNYTSIRIKKYWVDPDAKLISKKATKAEKLLNKFFFHVTSTFNITIKDNQLVLHYDIDLDEWGSLYFNNRSQSKL